MAADKKYDITVTTRTTYVPEQSDDGAAAAMCSPTRSRIKNTGTVAAQLISRHWIITDANNQVQEVRGLGVVGEQPMLAPEQTFEYTSGTAIATPVGTMRGSYQMVADDGSRVRGADPGIHAVDPAHFALSAAARAGVYRSRSSSRGFFGHVHHTMSISTASASPASSSSHNIFRRSGFGLTFAVIYCGA